jgi:DnaJ-domain-containing protein 1
MSNLFRIFIMATFGYFIGRAFGRPGFGALIGSIIGAMIPVEKYLKNSLALGFLSFLFLIIVLPPFLGFFGLILLIPLMLVYNLFSPRSTNRDQDRWFSFLSGNDINDVMVKLMAALTQVESSTQDRQAQAVKQFIALNGPGFSRKRLWKLFQDSLREDLNVTELAGELAGMTTMNQKKFFIQVLSELAAVNGSVSSEEESFIRTVNDQLGIPESELETILNQISQGSSRRTNWSGGRSRQRRRSPRRGRQTVKDAYETLGVSPSASREEVKEAYQEKVKQYHPDRHRNGDDSDVEEAEEKMAEINQAYQKIKEQW